MDIQSNQVSTIDTNVKVPTLSTFNNAENVQLLFLFACTIRISLECVAAPVFLLWFFIAGVPLNFKCFVALALIDTFCQGICVSGVDGGQDNLCNSQREEGTVRGGEVEKSTKNRII